MKIFLNPTGFYSPAMTRVSAALAKHAPEQFEIVDKYDDADLVVLHVIGPDSQGPHDKPYAVIQYCGSLEASTGAYQDLWSRARMVWSYYDLREHVPDHTPFLLAPLGVDPAFAAVAKWPADRSIAVMTSGRVTGPRAEAIEEVAFAAAANNKQVLHLGPYVIEGWEHDTLPSELPNWSAQEGINDATLAMLYRNTQRVSGLRQGEGFELPCIEGLLCGARPVVFDRADMRRWYDGVAEFVPECHGVELIDYLTALLSQPPRPVTESELAWAREMFNWERIADLFWQTMKDATRWSAKTARTKRRLLWIGDAVSATGFARGTHHTLDTLRHDFDVHVLGLNYYGDPHDYPYKIYPASSGGDYMGLGRVKALVESLGPSIAVVQNDPWHIQEYLRRCGNIPVVGSIAVDGVNCKGTELNGLAHASFWTEFGMCEARRGGYTGQASVIPLGVDRERYYPRNKAAVREKFGLPKVLARRGLPEDSFVIGVVGRNQWRKRLDLTLMYFAEWIKTRKIDNAVLWVHSAPTKDDAWDLSLLAGHLGIADRVMLPKIPLTLGGASEDTMADVYNLFDVLLSTTLGEGFGLPMFEAAASDVALVLPKWSGLAELFKDAAALVPCTSFCVHPNQVCVLGGIADCNETLLALDELYKSPETRRNIAARGRDRVSEERFDWAHIGAQWNQLLISVLDTPLREQVSL